MRSGLGSNGLPLFSRFSTQLLIDGTRKETPRLLPHPSPAATAYSPLSGPHPDYQDSPGAADFKLASPKPIPSCLVCNYQPCQGHQTGNVTAHFQRAPPQKPLPPTLHQAERGIKEMKSSVQVTVEKVTNGCRRPNTTEPVTSLLSKSHVAQDYPPVEGERLQVNSERGNWLEAKQEDEFAQG